MGNLEKIASRMAADFVPKLEAVDAKGNVVELRGPFGEPSSGSPGSTFEGTIENLTVTGEGYLQAMEGQEVPMSPLLKLPKEGPEPDEHTFEVEISWDEGTDAWMGNKVAGYQLLSFDGLGLTEEDEGALNDVIGNWIGVNESEMGQAHEAYAKEAKGEAQIP